jgi:hypothetical protein
MSLPLAPQFARLISMNLAARWILRNRVSGLYVIHASACLPTYRHFIQHLLRQWFYLRNLPIVHDWTDVIAFWPSASSECVKFSKGSPIAVHTRERNRFGGRYASTRRLLIFFLRNNRASDKRIKINAKEANTRTARVDHAARAR